MKKWIIYGGMFLSIGLAACGKSNSNDQMDGDNSDDMITNQADLASAKFAPPKWIQGTWHNNETGLTYKFHTNNICYITAGAETCFSELLKHYENLRLPAEFTQEANDTLYKFSYTVQEQEASFRFNKISASQISLTGTFGDIVLFEKQ